MLTHLNSHFSVSQYAVTIFKSDKHCNPFFSSFKHFSELCTSNIYLFQRRNKYLFKNRQLVSPSQMYYPGVGVSVDVNVAVL